MSERLQRADGILIPGGFGGRGWEGKITAARIARTRQIPYLGICLGMHVAVSEFARHVAGMEGANSTEMDLETPFPVIDLLPEQKEIADMGGTMRLGADPVKLHDGTRIRELYGDAVVYERHRHRYEVNNHLRQRLENVGLICSGTSPGRAARRGRSSSRATSTRSTSPPSTTRSSSPVRSARRRCSASSSARRLAYAEARTPDRPRRAGDARELRVGRGDRADALARAGEARHRRPSASACTRRSRRCAGSRAPPGTSAASPTG